MSASRVTLGWACSAVSGDQFLLFPLTPDVTKAKLWFLTALKPAEAE
jgi:hypothetical protein